MEPRSRSSQLQALYLALKLLTIQSVAAQPLNYTFLANTTFAASLELIGVPLPAPVLLANATLFVPSNQAFKELLAEANSTLDDLLSDIPRLANILVYHIYKPVKVNSSQQGGPSIGQLLAKQEPLITLQGSNITITGPPSANLSQVHLYDTLNRTAGLQSADISIVIPPQYGKQGGTATELGRVNIIDKVLLPFPLTQPRPMAPSPLALLDDPNLPLYAATGTLRRALDIPELSALTDALRLGNETFTMFCPTDEAFGKLYAAINTTEDELMASNILPALMLHHLVLDTAPKLIGRVAPLELETSLGDNLHVTFPDLVTALIRTGVFGHASVVNGLSDLRGGMAYLQAVDTVLVPDFQHLKRRLRRFRLRRMQEEQGQLQRGNQQAVSSDSSSETPGRTHHGRIHKLPGGGGMYTYG